MICFPVIRRSWPPFLVVHGALDEVVPVKDARRFAETFGAQLRIFPQGEHPLMGNGELEAVLAWAADFFLGKE